MRPVNTEWMRRPGPPPMLAIWLIVAGELFDADTQAAHAAATTPAGAGPRGTGAGLATAAPVST